MLEVRLVSVKSRACGMVKTLTIISSSQVEAIYG
jgi:hypothetical protein